MTPAMNANDSEGTAPNSRLGYIPLSVFLAAVISGCADVPATLESAAVIHLEEHLESALVKSAKPPTKVPNQVDWIFADGRANWRPLRRPATSEDDSPSGRASRRASILTNVDDALRLSLSDASRFGEMLIGGIYRELDDWNFDDWGMIVLRARTHHSVKGMLVLFGLDGDVIPRAAMSRLMHPSEIPPMFSDGRYVPADQRAKLTAWNREVRRGVVGRRNIFGGYREELGRLGIDAQTFYDGLRGLYDEAMEHQDYQLGRLVERLKARGEWQRTLLIIAADHGHPAGSFPRFGRGLLDPEPPEWEGALFGAFNTHIPLIFVWPDRIAGAQRFSQPVSMIDILPTVLDLVGLPPPNLTQGQSLAPLLLGEEGFKARPVILDEFRHDPGTGEIIGNIEIVDGRWGASLEIGPVPQGADPRFGRHAIPAAGRGYFAVVPRLLLYDLSSDPFAVQSVNERYPHLVEKYSELLLRQWKAHQALAKRFQPAEAAPLTPDELRALRSLGYIR